MRTAGAICSSEAFKVSIVSIEDVPGFMPGKDQEFGGFVRDGQTMLYVYCEEAMPWITVVMRADHGLVCEVMSTEHVHSHGDVARPSAVIAEGFCTESHRTVRR